MSAPPEGVTDEELAVIQKHGVEGAGWRTLRMAVDDLIDLRAAVREHQYQQGDAHPQDAKLHEMLRHAEPVASAPPAPVTKSRQCQWFDENDYRDPNDLACENVATHTTCDPAGAVVCAEHKCRCSKPLAVPSAATEEHR